MYASFQTHQRNPQRAKTMENNIARRASVFILWEAARWSIFSTSTAPPSKYPANSVVVPADFPLLHLVLLVASTAISLGPIASSMSQIVIERPDLRPEEITQKPCSALLFSAKFQIPCFQIPSIICIFSNIIHFFTSKFIYLFIHHLHPSFVHSSSIVFLESHKPLSSNYGINVQEWSRNYPPSVISQAEAESGDVREFPESIGPVLHLLGCLPRSVLPKRSRKWALLHPQCCRLHIVEHRTPPWPRAHSGNVWTPHTVSTPLPHVLLPLPTLHRYIRKLASSSPNISCRKTHSTQLR